MASSGGGMVLQHVHRLFGAGSVAGFAEDQLLDPFIADRDEAAFSALVVRHGPMVGSVCRLVHWGITCGPCVAQLSQVREAARHFAKTDPVVVGLHDSSGTADEVVDFAHKRVRNYPNAIDRRSNQSSSLGATFDDYGIHAIPSAAVIDRRGRVDFVGRLEEALAPAAKLVEE